MTAWQNILNLIIKALPPAGEITKVNKEHLSNCVIYVGGTSKEFGTDILLDAMRYVNEK